MTFAIPEPTLNDERTELERDPSDLDALLDEIRQALGLQAERQAIGKVEKAHHATYPRIEWVESGGTIDFSAPRYTGGSDGQIAIDACAFDVTLWHRNKAECRRLLHDLIRACRDVCDGPNVVFGSYEWIADANVNHGRKLALQVTFHLPIYEAPSVQTATVLHHDHTQTLQVGDSEPSEVARIVWSAPS